jgi:hypothetical protein
MRKERGRPPASEPKTLLVVFGRGNLRVGSRDKIEALLNERAANGASGKVRVYRLTPCRLRKAISLVFHDGY